MKSKLQKRMALLICFVFLFTFSFGQLVNAQDIEIYKSGEVQKYSAANLEGTKPDTSNANIQTIDLINGTVKFTPKIPSGSKYDILRSDNGGQYVKLTDFPLENEDFVDKYVLNGHTYYYMVVVYDANGAVLSNNGPYKAVAREGVSTSSKTIILQLNNQYASVDGVKYTLDVKPFLQDGRTMVPLRFISEALGAQVDWLGSERKITVKLNGNNINLWIGKSEAKINNDTVYMDVPAMITNNTTLIPIRFVIENLKLTVDFNDKTKEITISGGQPGTQPPAAISTPQPTYTSENTLKNIIKSGNKYYGVSSENSTQTKFSITFSDYKEETGGFSNEQTVSFKGKIEWIGYNFYDFIEGNIEGDQITFRQVSRYQNDNLISLLNSVSTMKIESSNKVSGTWTAFPSRQTGTIWFEFTSSAPISTPQPANTNESTLKNIVKSGKTYSGVSTQGSISAKYAITFSNYNEQTSEFKGKIEWIGYNVFDDLAGKIDGDKIIFKQIARYQNNTTTAMDSTVTMKIESSNRVSGTWIDSLTGGKGTTWFEFTPFATTPVTTSQAKYNGNFDSKGFPTGKATLEFGNDITFTGDVKVEKNNFIATGVITYTDGSKAIGRFVNGKPDGLSTIVYPNQKAYLIDFKYGEPVNYYVANTIPTFKAADVEMFKSDDIEEFQADGIEEFRADDIQEFQADNIDKYNADSIEPYKAEIIEKYKAQPVERNLDIVTLDKYQAEVGLMNPPRPSNADIPVGGFTSPDYMNPLVQVWTAHMTALPYLINNNMGYSY